MDEYAKSWQQGGVSVPPSTPYGGGGMAGVGLRPPKGSAIAEARENVAAAVKTLAQLTEQATMIANQVFGEAPAKGVDPQGVRAVSGVIGDLSYEIQNLHGVIASLRNQIERLSCL